VITDHQHKYIFLSVNGNSVLQSEIGGYINSNYSSQVKLFTA